ncbi:hypothetical protein BR141012304_10489 [Brucella inopinata]|nr:hypothetical protein BR141012304_10489 [Brucella inopinata]
MLVEPRLALGHCAAAQCCQPDHVEAETGIKRIGERIEPFARKAQENPVVAQGLACFDTDMAHLAIDPEERRLKQKRALAFHFKLRKQRLRQFPQYVLDQLHPCDGFRQATFGGSERQDAHGGNRCALAPRQPVESGGKIGAETGGEGRAGQRHHIADPFQPGAFEAGFCGLR